MALQLKHVKQHSSLQYLVKKNSKNCKLIYNSKILSLVKITVHLSFQSTNASKFCFSMAARFSAFDLEKMSFISAIVDFSSAANAYSSAEVL